jgi:TnpA family transposase
MACASDSKKVGRLGSKPQIVHLRYGGKGIIIDWNIEKHAA